MNRTVILSICVLLAQAFEFASIEEALSFDTSLLAPPTCANQQEYKQTISNLDSLLNLLNQNPQEVQSDIEILEASRDNILETQSILMGLNQDLQLEKTQFKSEPKLANLRNQNLEKSQVQQVLKSQTEHERVDSLWDQSFIQKTTVNFVENFKKIHSSNIVDQLNDIVNLSQKLDSDLGIKDDLKRSQKKLEMANSMIDQLNFFIEGLDRVANNQQFVDSSRKIISRKVNEMESYENQCRESNEQSVVALNQKKSHKHKQIKAQINK